MDANKMHLMQALEVVHNQEKILTFALLLKLFLV